MNEVAVQQQNMLTPNNLGDAMKLAEMMAGAKLVPAHLQSKPADCLLVIEQASRWKMSPFAVAQSTSVIQGKLMYEGKLVAAVVNANGNLAERLSYSYEGAGDNRKVVVSGKIRGESEARKVEVLFKDAKTSNSMWQKQGDQQLMYHGARVWARRHVPELMLGVYTPEEFDEQQMVNVTPSLEHSTTVTASVDPVTGEVSRPSIFKTATARNLFTKNAVEAYKKAETLEELKTLMRMDSEKLQSMKDGDERDALAYGEIRKHAEAAMARLKDAPAPHPVDDGGISPEEIAAWQDEERRLEEQYGIGGVQ